MGFHVDFSAMSKAETNLRALAKDGEGIAALAKDADPEWYIWGLLGAPLAAAYFPASDDVHEHLTDMHEALDAHADRIKRCADQYHGRETETSASMNAIRSNREG